MPTYDTASVIINSAAAELGLPPVTISTDYTDATGAQALALLQALCDELYRAHDWQNLEQIMTFTGDGSSTTFDLPADFGRQVNQTQWATSDARPLMGPDSPQAWSWVKYGIVSVGVFFQYRLLRGQYTVWPTPAAGEAFALYYISNGYIQDGTAPAVYKTKIARGTDIPQFDSRLLITGLKVKFWAQKGFDTALLEKEFDYVLKNEQATIQGARVINLSGGGDGMLIGWQNVPDGTYYGT